MTTDTDILDWLESQYSLHHEVEITYIVDGYVVEFTYDGNPTDGKRYHGDNLREALCKAMIAKEIEMASEAIEVKYEGDCVNVYVQPGEGASLTLRRYSGELGVGVSSCLSGTFIEAEAQARAYVEAFELARRVL